MVSFSDVGVVVRVITAVWYRRYDLQTHGDQSLFGQVWASTCEVETFGPFMLEGGWERIVFFGRNTFYPSNSML